MKWARSTGEDVGAVAPGQPSAPGSPVVDGRYRILGVLGDGGFSRVYRAHAEHLARVVAVKVLTAVPDDAVLDRFYKEADRTAQFAHHQNIVKLLDHGLTATGQPFLTTELYERGSVSDQVRTHGPQPVRETLRIGIEMCGALETVHRHRIFHRDVKPQNILLNEYGDPALADFGIATINRALETTSATSAGFTPVHAPPEIWENQPATAASDIYSLGSTLYEMLQGRPAFLGPDDTNLVAIMVRVLNEPAPPLDRPDVPALLRTAIDHAMAKEPGRRFQSAAAFGEYLQAVQRELGFPPTEMRFSAPRGPSTESARTRVSGESVAGGIPGATETSTRLDIDAVSAGTTLSSGLRGPAGQSPGLVVGAGALPPTGAVSAPRRPPAGAGASTGHHPAGRTRRALVVGTASLLVVAFLGVVSVRVLGWSAGNPVAAPPPTAPVTSVAVTTAPPSAAGAPPGGCQVPERPGDTVPPGIPRVTEVVPLAGDATKVEVRWTFDEGQPTGEIYSVLRCDRATGQPLVEGAGVVAASGARSARAPAPPAGVEPCYWVLVTYLLTEESISSAAYCP